MAVRSDFTRPQKSDEPRDRELVDLDFALQRRNVVHQMLGRGSVSPNRRHRRPADLFVISQELFPQGTDGHRREGEHRRRRRRQLSIHLGRDPLRRLASLRHAPPYRPIRLAKVQPPRTVMPINRHAPHSKPGTIATRFPLSHERPPAHLMCTIRAPRPVFQSKKNAATD